MKTAEETKEHAGLVRDLIAATEIDFPADDFERDLRDALYRKAFAIAEQMDVGHIRRINEALCKMQFPSPSALALRRKTLSCLARSHGLKEYRNVKMPVIKPPARSGAGRAREGARA